MNHLKLLEETPGYSGTMLIMFGGSDALVRNQLLAKVLNEIGIQACLVDVPAEFRRHKAGTEEFYTGDLDQRIASAESPEEINCLMEELLACRLQSELSAGKDTWIISGMPTNLFQAKQFTALKETKLRVAFAVENPDNETRRLRALFRDHGRHTLLDLDPSLNFRQQIISCLRHLEIRDADLRIAGRYLDTKYFSALVEKLLEKSRCPFRKIFPMPWAKPLHTIRAMPAQLASA